MYYQMDRLRAEVGAYVACRGYPRLLALANFSVEVTITKAPYEAVCEQP